jgi:transcriptional regulator with XRE-family HTH domain
MTFGQALRAAREAQGVSRFCLTLMIKEKFRAQRVTLSESTIQSLETGACLFPRRTTLAILTAVLPELSQSLALIDSQTKP